MSFPKMKNKFASTLLSLVVLTSVIVVSPSPTMEPLPASESTVSNENLNSNSSLTVEITSIIDQILDLALERMRKKTPDPAFIQDQVRIYKKRILFFDITGDIKMYNGKLWGLNKIERYGDAPYNMTHGMVHMSPTFIFNDLTVCYDFVATVLNLNPTGKINGYITNLIIETEVTIDVFKRSITIEQAKLLKARKLTVHIESSRVIDYFANYILKVFTSIFKSSLLNLLDKEIKHYLGHGIHIVV